jgi:hypothetical protein
MAEKHLFRDTAREEYFYQLGRQEAFREAGASAVALALQSVVRNARDQIDDA